MSIDLPDNINNALRNRTRGSFPEAPTMPNDAVHAAVSGFQQKLESFKTKIELQQLLAQSLATEFESLTAEFEALKQLLGPSLPNLGSTIGNKDSTSLISAAASPGNESPSSNVESSSMTARDLSTESESLPPNNGASLTIQELAFLIQRTVSESLKIYYSKPNVPNRMAQIVLALRKSEKLTVAQMGQITGASRNTLTRDIKALKSLRWIEFHGSRKYGYFTLAASFPGLEKIPMKDSGTKSG